MQEWPHLNRQVSGAEQSDQLGNDAMLDDSCNAVIWAVSNVGQGPAGITDNLQGRSTRVRRTSDTQQNKP